MFSFYVKFRFILYFEKIFQKSENFSKKYNCENFIVKNATILPKKYGRDFVNYDILKLLMLSLCNKLLFFLAKFCLIFALFYSFMGIHNYIGFFLFGWRVTSLLWKIPPDWTLRLPTPHFA